MFGFIAGIMIGGMMSKGGDRPRIAKWDRCKCKGCKYWSVTEVEYDSRLGMQVPSDYECIIEEDMSNRNCKRRVNREDVR